MNKEKLKPENARYIQELLSTGWKPKYTSRQAVKLATKALVRSLA